MNYKNLIIGIIVALGITIATIIYSSPKSELQLDSGFYLDNISVEAIRKDGFDHPVGLIVKFVPKYDKRLENREIIVEDGSYSSPSEEYSLMNLLIAEGHNYDILSKALSGARNLCIKHSVSKDAVSCVKFASSIETMENIPPAEGSTLAGISRTKYPAKDFMQKVKDFNSVKFTIRMCSSQRYRPEMLDSYIGLELFEYKTGRGDKTSKRLRATDQIYDALLKSDAYNEMRENWEKTQEQFGCPKY